MKDDGFDDDFSLDDGSEEEEDDAFSAASEEDDDSDDAGGDDTVSDEDDLAESDFDDDAPKAKRGKKTPAAAKGKAVAAKKAAPAAAAKKKAGIAPAPTRKPASKTATKAKSSPVKKSGSSTAVSPTAAPVQTMKAGDAKAAVLDYMRKTNRPYSMLNVFENMHRVIAKPSLTKILDDLCDKEELMSKTYGKAKIYYMNQNKLPVPSAEERARIEQQIKATEVECASIEQELKASEAALTGINSQISDADLETALAVLEEEHQALQKKLAAFEKPGQKPISPGRKDALKRKFNTYRTAWVQRKRIVVDAVNQVADGMEKKPAAVYTLIGIETDAEVGVKEIPPAII